MRRRAGLAVLAALLPAAVAARVRSQVPLMTRLVKLFLEREIALFEAEAARDRATLERLLAPDFEQRDAAAPGRPQPRAAWLAARAGAAVDSDISLEQMAVHDLGESALVSFVARPQPGAPLFVVDLWRRSGDDWRLQVRYRSAAG